jgi:hypothetical protein
VGQWCEHDAYIRTVGLGRKTDALVAEEPGESRRHGDRRRGGGESGEKRGPKTTAAGAAQDVVPVARTIERRDELLERLVHERTSS